MARETPAVGRSALLEDELRRQQRRKWYKVLVRFVRQKPLGAIAALMIVAVLVMGFAAPLIAPWGQFQTDNGYELQGYSWRHWMGTDQWGRDIMTRIFYGARISLLISLLSVVVGSGTGALWGVASGYLMGKVDLISQRVVDALMSIPLLIVAMAVVAALGASIPNLVIAIAVTFAPRVARVTRSAAISLRERQYVDAARAVGASDSAIILRHVAPNCMAPFLVVATAELGTAILVESSLSFLGLGTREPRASLGAMLSGAVQNYFVIAPWMAIWPGVVLALAVFGWNVLGDALRDVLDPRLRRG
ncbi:MAG: ABC transporter permease [Chloroflexi bacterium]|nr:ABC transporter permease [Chloroflexota bacterium]